MVTLVFPSPMPDAIAYAQGARERGEAVIGASSVKADETAKIYDQWVFLPSVYDDDFPDKFTEVVANNNVTAFFTPHGVIYEIVKGVVSSKGLKLALPAVSPLETLDTRFKELMQQAEESQPFIEAITSALGVTSQLTTLERAAIFRHASHIYGQTNDSKMMAMMAIFADCPKGDIVEIGSAWGRSAFVLQALSRKYGIGPVVAVDPWQSDIATQNESSDTLNAVSAAIDWDAMFQMFVTHLLPCANGDVTYMRTTSEEAAKQYRQMTAIETPEFGNVAVSGKVAVLHIDGNHDFDAVDIDYKSWRDKLAPGGWIIFDDYVWEHGHGPRQVGDRTLEQEADVIEHAFTCGKALFVKFRQ